MFTSTLFAVIGFLGAGYSFIVSAVSINKGPKCLMSNNTWGYPFHNGSELLLKRWLRIGLTGGPQLLSSLCLTDVDT
ncbi:hypothetical protein A6R68_10406, partial [Neotoma lepida]